MGKGLQKLTEEPPEGFRHRRSGRSHFLMIEGVPGQAGGAVGDAGEGGHPETGMPGRDRLRNGGHPDRIRPEEPESSDLGRGFIGRPAGREVNP